MYGLRSSVLPVRYDDQGMATGCPLHNLVPEWNDLVIQETGKQAYNRLKKTNNFRNLHPESARHFARRHVPVTERRAGYTKENEYSIIENAYEKGYATAKPKSAPERRLQSSVPVHPDLRQQTSLTDEAISVTVYERRTVSVDFSVRNPEYEAGKNIY